MKNNIDCLVLLDKENNVRAVYISDEDRKVGIHNMGVTSEQYKERGFHFVIGKLEYEDKI
jgi:hypothetical protein